MGVINPHTHHLLALAFGLLGNLVSFMVYLAPLPTFYKVNKKKNTEGWFQSITYVVVALFSAMLWMFYAPIKTDGFLLLIINTVGCIIVSMYIIAYFIYAPRPAKIYTTKLLLMLNVLVYGLILLFTMLFSKGSKRVTIVGWICSVFAVCLFAAPLSIMKKVITTKSVEFMPISLFFFLTLCTLRATAAPIILQDSSKCGSADVPVPTNCCPPPTNLEIVDFMGSLIGDPTFALPFWNWDAPGGMRMPTLYTDPNSTLYDPRRDAKHQPPKILDLDYGGLTDNPKFSEQEQIDINLKAMYRVMVSGGKTSQLFLGSPYRAGDQPNPGAGSLENSPHGPVHLWSGDRTAPNFENMGTFYSAGRDPIFFSHHSNVDRMWTLWKALGGKRKDFTDPDWLNAGFLFYDENKQLVRVKVGDCLDQKNLRYTYQQVDIPWLKSRPTPSKVKTAVAKRDLDLVNNTFPRTLDSVVRIKVSRPKKEKKDEEEILVVEGVEFESGIAVKIDIYVNAEDEFATSPATTEFAGSFVNVPRKRGIKMKKLNTFLRLGITDLLEDIGAEDDEIMVSLVPRQGKDVSIQGIKIVVAS